eukprot:m51a1_g8728 putative kinesin-like protein kif19 (565) ;mRNA; r:4336-7037
MSTAAAAPPGDFRVAVRVVVLQGAPSAENDYLRQKQVKERKYAFDVVFDQTATQVFAYGATGAGKTFTMLGNANEDEQGIMTRTVESLFVSLSQDKDITFSVSISYIEVPAVSQVPSTSRASRVSQVYNEQLRDLLMPSDRVLQLREDPIKGVVVSNISEHPVRDASQIMGLLQKGNSHRSEAPTAANPVSSRSHAVCQVVVTTKPRLSGVVTNVKNGKLSLVDLAGSERASATEDSLGGNCRTCMIACVSCASSCFEETLNTLKYADRAKSIKIKAEKNEKQVHYHVQEYEKLITELRDEISTLKTQLASVPTTVVDLEDAGTSTLEESLQSSTDEHLPPLPGAMDGRQPTPMSMNPSLLRTQGFGKLWSELAENFHERLEIKKTIGELKRSQIECQRKLDKQMRKIEMWKAEGETSASGETIDDIETTCEYLRASIKDNEEQLRSQEEVLKEIEETRASLEELIPNMISQGDRRQLLELLIHSQQLELTNMELELQLRIKDRIIEDQEAELKQAVEDMRRSKRASVNAIIPSLKEYASQSASGMLFVPDTPVKKKKQKCIVC